MEDNSPAGKSFGVEGVLNEPQGSLDSRANYSTSK